MNEEPIPVGKRIALTAANVLSVPAAFALSFMIFIAGVFASDSGSAKAITISYAILAMAVAYPILTVFIIVWSRKRHSLGLALLPFIFPILLFGWVFSPWFAFS